MTGIKALIGKFGKRNDPSWGRCIKALRELDERIGLRLPVRHLVCLCSTDSVVAGEDDMPRSGDSGGEAARLRSQRNLCAIRAHRDPAPLRVEFDRLNSKVVAQVGLVGADVLEDALSVFAADEQLGRLLRLGADDGEGEHYEGNSYRLIPI